MQHRMQTKKKRKSHRKAKGHSLGHPRQNDFKFFVTQISFYGHTIYVYIYTICVFVFLGLLPSHFWVVTGFTKSQNRVTGNYWGECDVWDPCLIYLFDPFYFPRRMKRNELYQ